MDDVNNTPATPIPPVASPVQVPATPEAHPSCVVKGTDTIYDIDPFHGQGGDFKIDPDTGKRVRA